MEQNKFDKALQELLIMYAPKPIVKCGDILTVKAGWLKPHKVKIYEIWAELADYNIGIGKQKELGVDGWFGVQLTYLAKRLNNKDEMVGSGFSLSSFITESGQNYERQFPTFNHWGLTYVIDSLKKESCPDEIEEMAKIGVAPFDHEAYKANLKMIHGDKPPALPSILKTE